MNPRLLPNNYFSPKFMNVFIRSFPLLLVQYICGGFLGQIP